MRRRINWFVFCISVAFLFASVSPEPRPVSPTEEAATPVAVQMGFSHITVGDPAPPQFGYVRDDGSFVPLGQQAGTQTATDQEITAAF